MTTRSLKKKTINEEVRKVVFSKIIDELKNRGAVTSGLLSEDLDAP